MIDLPTQTVLIGGGGAGSEARKLCAAFGMRVARRRPAGDGPADWHG